LHYGEKKKEGKLRESDISPLAIWEGGPGSRGKGRPSFGDASLI